MVFVAYYWQIVIILLTCEGYFNESLHNPLLIIEDESIHGKIDKTIDERKSYYSSHTKPPVVDLRLQVGNPPIVNTTNGPIQGIRSQTISGLTTYNKFLGIPYAKPPVGSRRFQAPEPADPWNTTLLCTQDTNQCTQGSNPVGEQEDCLYLNVFAPADNKIRNVMFWIYGGGFNTGNASSKYYQPDYFLDYDVVFVSVNYRLGAFGFLGTEDSACPGNMGLKDQILALKWVQSNIRRFGGNPNSVTIFGQSAGSASVSYLLQMDASKGLFHAAILESGTSTCMWALNRNARNIAFELGRQTGVNATNTSSLVAGLRGVDYRQIQTAADLMYNTGSATNLLTGLVWSPVNKPPESGFSGDSDEQIRNGQFHKVPIIYGVNTNEAAFLSNSFLGRIFVGLLSTTFQSRLAPVGLTTNQTKLNAAERAINWRYFRFLPAAFQVNRVTEFLNDDFFNRPIVRATVDSTIPLDAPPVRLYLFAYESSPGWDYMQQTGPRFSRGAGHGEEMGYLFVPRNNNTVLSNDDLLMRRRMLTLWTNFAKYKNPTPNITSVLQNVTWVPANTISGSVTYLDINLDLRIRLNPFEDSINFWNNEIYARYGDPPYDTY